MEPLGGVAMPSFSAIEVDVIEMTVGCAERCLHCSESPESGMQHTRLEVLSEAIETLCSIETREGLELFGLYWYPFPASDPFAYPQLAELCRGMWRRRGLAGYMLSLGWNRGRGRQNALALCGAPECLFRLGITVSNFSRLAQLNPFKHRERLAQSLLDLRPLWNRCGPDGRPLIFLSPQFVQEAGGESPFSWEQTDRLLGDVLVMAGLDPLSWIEEGRIHPRPVVGFGRAVTELAVTATSVIPITAETPCPPISQFPERKYSGLITAAGRLAVLESKRGLLGRERETWTNWLPLTGNNRPLARGFAEVPSRAVLSS
jgi:hypothetical protein